MVAMNSTLSDLSFLAIAITPGSISPDTLPGTDYDYASAAAATRRRRTKSGQQSSVGTGSRHQLPWPGRTGVPAASPPPHSPTDDCSPLPPSRVGLRCGKRAYELLELPPTVRVVTEHVEARARRREQHHT